MSDYTPTSLSAEALIEADLMDVFMEHMETCRETRGKRVNEWLDKLEARIEGGCSWKMHRNALRMVELNVTTDKDWSLEEPFAPEGTAELIDFLAGC